MNLFSESILILRKIRYGTEHATGLTCGNSSEIIQGLNLSNLICNILFIGRVQIGFIVFVLTFASPKAHGTQGKKNQQTGVVLVELAMKSQCKDYDTVCRNRCVCRKAGSPAINPPRTCFFRERMNQGSKRHSLAQEEYSRMVNVHFCYICIFPQHFSIPISD